MESAKEIERSIIKKYRKQIWAPFVRAIKDYHLIEENDAIAVCISGGKDSFLLAKCMQEIQKHGKITFTLKFIVMDPGYAEENKKQIVENAKKMNIPIEIYNSNIFAIVTKQTEGNPCYLCAKMRRGFLYETAQKLGCNKIALGHHFDDVLETTLLNIFYGGEVKTMLPKLHSKNFANMELIRPLYYVKEKDIIAVGNYHHLTFLNCACTFTKQSHHNEELSKRKEMKKLIESFRAKNKYVETSLFKCVDNVNLDAVLGYRKNGKKYSFQDTYNQKEE